MQEAGVTFGGIPCLIVFFCFYLLVMIAGYRILIVSGAFMLLGCWVEKRPLTPYNHPSAKKEAPMTQPGKIILINGASSAGKSTLARAVQQQFPLPLLHISFDLFIDGDILPWPQIRAGTFAWQTMRPTVFDGYFRCWAALAQAGNHLIIDHIVETEASLRYMLQLLAGIDVFFVALHCALDELERREEARGDRRSGDARTDLAIVHRHTRYDLELHSDKAIVEENVAQLIAAWERRQRPSAFERMAAEIGVA